MDEEPDRELADQERNTSQSSADDGVASRYFSVKVTPPGFLPLVPPEAASTSGGATYSYLRIGEPDTDVEPRLPTEPKDPKPGPRGPSPWGEGVLLYTTGGYQQNARSVTESTTKRLEILQDGQNLTRAAYATGVDGLKITYQRGIEVTATLGAVVNQTLGAQYNFWGGNWVNLTSGMSLAGTFGSQITLSPLQSIALAPGFARLGGLASLEATKQHFIVANGPVRLSSGPENKAAAEDMEGWYERARRALAMVARASPSAAVLGTPLLAPLAAAGSEITWAAAGGSSAKLEAAMKATGAASVAVGGLLSLIQAGIIIAAGIMRYETAPKAIAEGLEGDTSAILMLDGKNPASNGYLKVGTRWLLFGQDGTILIRNGDNGPQISLGTDTIALSVGEHSITLSREGVFIAGEQVNCIGGNAGTLLLDETGALVSGSSVRVDPAAPAAAARAAAVTARNAAARLAEGAEGAERGPAEVFQYFRTLAEQNA